MTNALVDHPPGDEDRLVRVTVLLPRHLVRTLDARTKPGLSRGAVCRAILTDGLEAS